MALGACLAVLVAGCSSGDALAQQYKSGTGQNYVAGDGSVTEIAEGNRQDAVTYSGVTETGKTVKSSDFSGQPVVINYWYAACAPCRVEAPDLEKIYVAYHPKGVQFLGVNVRDSAETAKAFIDNFHLSYPSVIDVTDRSGGMLLAFSGYVSPNTVPTTLVLDREGRVAARISGRVDPSTLTSLLDTVVAER